jgi:CheY-like chemotaxis protein
MIPGGRPIKVLLIDSNVYFAKRLADALKREGFQVVTSTQAAFALTTLEYDAPQAILCATNMREMGALEIARIIHADSKNSNLPIIALGDGSQRALMEAFQAGCDDYIDRNGQPGVIATHVKQIIISKAEGFQPTQMLTQSDTSLSGNLTHHDLTGVMQMLGHARQTGALHINAGDTDGVLFYDAGEITHAECGNLFGDEAVIHILKSCVQGGAGVYKFVYGASSAQRTVLRTATDLMLDAMREFDEDVRDMADKEAQ